MDCTVAREGLSALLDGEPLGVEPAELERHLATCPDCRAWRDSAHVVTRHMRLALARPAPAPGAPLLAAVSSQIRRKRWTLSGLMRVRLGLVAVAAAQIALTVPQLILGSDHEAPIHVAHEMGSFDMALAVGFLFAAWQPVRARGMHVLVGAAALLLVITALIDVTSGRTTPADELPHLLAVVGWLLMYRVAVLTPTGVEPAERLRVGFPRQPQTILVGPPLWQEERGQDLSAGLDAEPAVGGARRAAGR
jgi:predicted anti-sigma-YlaC factor YlaD